VKLLIITNLFPNAAEPQRAVYNKQQFTALKDLCELKVIAPIPLFKYPKTKVPDVETIEGMEVFHPRYLVIPKILRALYGILYYLGIGECVRELYGRFRFDVIFATWAYPDAFAAALLAKRLRKPLVIKVHGSDINVFTKYHLRRKMILFALNQAEKVIAVSDALKAKIVELGVDPEKIILIPNGIDTELFRSMDKKDCRLNLAIPLEQRFILYVGNLEPIKGTDLLIDALHKLPEDVHLYMIGDGSLKESMKIRAKDLTMENRVHFLGRLPHTKIPFWMSACDLFCLPSRNEGCPNVILEALACGVPIVASHVGGIPQLIKDSSQGILV